MGRMFIRQTRTCNNSADEGYFTFRLVRGERIGGNVSEGTTLAGMLRGLRAPPGALVIMDAGS